MAVHVVKSFSFLSDSKSVNWPVVNVYFVGVDLFIVLYCYSLAFQIHPLTLTCFNVGSLYTRHVCLKENSDLFDKSNSSFCIFKDS